MARRFLLSNLIYFSEVTWESGLPFLGKYFGVKKYPVLFCKVFCLEPSKGVRNHPKDNMSSDNDFCLCAPIFR